MNPESGLGSLPGVDARYEYSSASRWRSENPEMGININRILPDGVIGIFKPRVLILNYSMQVGNRTDWNLYVIPHWSISIRN